MALISKIGPLELSLISFLGVLTLYRIQAAPASRVATGLVFIFTARFGASFINGFAISDATKASLGELDTVFAYVMLGFAFLEVLLLKHEKKWSSYDLALALGVLGIGFLYLGWKLTYNFQLISSDFLYLLPIFLFLALRPTRSDLRFLPYFGAVVILLVFFTALIKYQNPLHPYSGVDYGLGSPYQNRVWVFFGLEERFRGPYFHPNQLGIQITFLSLLVLVKPSKLYIAILPISFTLLFLASSRTSIAALLTGLLVRIYFDSTIFAHVNPPHLERDLPSIKLRKGLTLRKMVALLVCAAAAAVVIREIFKSNITGTGRLDNNRRVISAIRDNFFLGQGPSLFSVNNTENTVLTILSFYGLTGLALIVVISFALILMVRNVVDEARRQFQMTLSCLLIASAGEALLTGSSADTGLYYLLLLLTLTKSGPLKNGSNLNSTVT